MSGDRAWDMWGGRDSEKGGKFSVLYWCYDEEDTRVEFSEEAVRAYLDRAIRYWRKVRDAEGSYPVGIYVDAFQAVRLSLFGECLAGDARGD